MGVWFSKKSAMYQHTQTSTHTRRPATLHQAPVVLNQRERWRERQKCN